MLVFDHSWKAVTPSRACSKFENRQAGEDHSCCADDINYSFFLLNWTTQEEAHSPNGIEQARRKNHPSTLKTLKKSALWLSIFAKHSKHNARVPHCAPVGMWVGDCCPYCWALMDYELAQTKYEIMLYKKKYVRCRKEN